MINKMFPEITPYDHGWLSVGDGHEIHWEVSGNPNAMPVVWLHGGPGSQSSPIHRRFFDPQRFHMVQFDQRGCGLSRPAGGISNNTTDDLVSDIETLRNYLHINHWYVVGGSWGGALALAYAQRHGEVIKGLLLRSTFLCGRSEISDFLQHPPLTCRAPWQHLMGLVSENLHHDFLRYGHEVFCINQHVEIQAQLAKAWATYEAAMNAYPDSGPMMNELDTVALIQRYRIQCHYLIQNCFITTNYLLQPSALKKLPITIIHGEEDAICSVENSWRIKKSAPHAKLVILPNCGHGLMSAQTICSLLGEIKKMSESTLVGGCARVGLD
jgi:proline iminopeptidase